MPTLLSTRLRKILAWLALCAMVFGSAAPTATYWLFGSEQAQELIEICGASGMTLVPASHAQGQAQDPQKEGQPAGGQPSDEGCPYCSLTHHWPYVPATGVSFAPHAPPGIAPRPEASAPAPVLPEQHRPYLPRAPPQVPA